MTINKEMPILEIVQKYPETIRTFFAHGLMCVGCAAARFETLEQGAMAHGIDVDSLVEALNEAVNETITEKVEQ